MTTRIEAQHPDHAEALFTALSDPRLYQFLDEDPPASVEALRAQIARRRAGPAEGAERWLNWTVFHDGVAAGYTQATLLADRSVRIAYVLAPAFWGRGVAHEAAGQMLRLLIRDEAPKVFLADTMRANQRSRRLLARLGFHLTHETETEAFFTATPAEVTAALAMPEGG